MPIRELVNVCLNSLVLIYTASESRWNILRVGRIIHVVVFEFDVAESGDRPRGRFLEKLSILLIREETMR